jgi:hypothetical protein
MARRKSDTRSPGVVFTKQAADRIASAVRTVERGSGTVGAGHWGYRADEGDFFKLGRTNSSWGKGASKTITIYSGTPLSETPVTPTETVTAYNKFADISANRWVMLGQLNGNWYVIAAEC